MVALERDGRTCHFDLVNTVRIAGNDPRDIWLLKRAVEDGKQWLACETYFLERIGVGAITPVKLRLGQYSDEARSVFLDHDPLDGNNERTAIHTVDQLMEVLPALAHTNSIGYHRARNRIVDRFEELRPRTWAEIGIEDPAVIAEYAKHGPRLTTWRMRVSAGSTE